MWLGTKLDEFISQGMEMADMEELRGFGMKYLDGAGFDQTQRQALISIMIRFKDLVGSKRRPSTA